MATAKKTQPPRPKKAASFGLLANGAAGAWQVDIDETTASPERWFAQLEGPSITFCFEISSVAIVGEMRRFLETGPAPTNASSNGTATHSNTLTLGKDKEMPVTLIRDEEYQDRFFLVVGLIDSSPTIRYTLAGADVVQLTDALRQVEQDLEDED